MSLNVFYFLHVDNKFINLIDLDDVLRKVLNLEPSSKEYIKPEGNTVCWVDMLAGALLELPSHIDTTDMDFDEIMDAVYHYNSTYLIRDVNSYIKFFYYLRSLGIKINARYADLSMFDDESRKHYRSLYDKEEWFSKEELLEYMMSRWDESVTEKTSRGIVNEMYLRRKKQWV